MTLNPFTPSRDAALAQLKAFLPRAGRTYADRRNYDCGPDERGNVSMLSPYLRHRLITEEDVIAIVLSQHTAATADKFIQEVCWRTYWKGWLEQRPSIWTNYLAELGEGREVVQHNAGKRLALHQATAGETGIACFDAWVKELVATGYLHNHARMWFASIWIFTLKLPWVLGADFFYRHLLDGDPASNTLSWRWVAGLQTRGKHYVARASNIQQFTDSRFYPAGQLNEAPDAIEGPEAPPVSKLRTLPTLRPETIVTLIVTEDDLHPESWAVASGQVQAVSYLETAQYNNDLSDTVRAFRRAALEGSVRRAAAHFGCRIVPTTKIEPGSTVVTSEIPIGPSRTRIDEFNATGSQRGLQIVELRRPWDAAFWPHAMKGFFNLKEKIPKTLETIGLLRN